MCVCFFSVFRLYTAPCICCLVNLSANVFCAPCTHSTWIILAVSTKKNQFGKLWPFILSICKIYHIIKEFGYFSKFYIGLSSEVISFLVSIFCWHLKWHSLFSSAALYFWYYAAVFLLIQPSSMSQNACYVIWTYSFLKYAILLKGEIEFEC